MKPAGDCNSAVLPPTMPADLSASTSHCWLGVPTSVALMHYQSHSTLPARGLNVPQTSGDLVVVNSIINSNQPADMLYSGEACGGVDVEDSGPVYSYQASYRSFSLTRCRWHN